MTWIIIIILVLVVVFTISNQQHNKTVVQHHLNQGGLRKSFPTFTNHLENYYEMTHVNDTGRDFYYAKDINDTNGNKGKLIVGVKLDMADKPMIYSKFQSKYKGEFGGINILATDFKNIDAIDNSVNISIDSIKKQGVIDYQDRLSGLINHDVQKEFIDEWNIIVKESFNTEISDELQMFVNNFYVPDLICPQKFVKNLSILNNTLNEINLTDLVQNKGFDVGDIASLYSERKKIKEGTQGTASVADISHIPPMYSYLFLAAYPDVYQWLQKNAESGKINIFNKLNLLSNDEAEKFLQSPKKINEMYKNLINEFKDEGNELETKITTANTV
jgi:hypothetical protein